MICVDNLDTGSLQNVAHLRSEEFTFVNHDLTEPLFSEENVDVVFHLASPASPIDYMRLPLHTLKVGSYGTHRMLGLPSSSAPASCSPRRARSTATRKSSRRRKRIGET